MDCNEARPLLDADFDHELPATDALRLQRHVDGCDACRRERAALAALRGAVRRADYHRAPDALRARIVAGLPGGAEPIDEAAATRPSGTRRRGWFGLGGSRAGDRGKLGPREHAAGVAARPARAIPAAWLALAALAVGAAGGAALTAQRLTADRLAGELVASHVRAELTARDVDVISSDRHTVKPWFNGRLDYAPPVADLAASGFPLAGGRLDYVGGHRVAVLVYRYRQHVIDVYVFPGSDGAGSRAATRQGYALARWQAAGMTWWAVTDAEPAALDAFRTALDARLSTPRSE